jgi:hypothetical protein
MDEEHKKVMKEVWTMTKNLKIVLDSLQDPIYVKLASIGHPKADIMFNMDALRADIQNALYCWNAEGDYISN